MMVAASKAASKQLISLWISGKKKKATLFARIWRANTELGSLVARRTVSGREQLPSSRRGNDPFQSHWKNSTHLLIWQLI